MENQIFSNSIIFSGIGNIFRALSFGTFKTRFKALWDIFSENLHMTLDSQVTFFMDVYPQRATKTRNFQYTLYKDNAQITSWIMISISKNTILTSFSPFSKAWNQSFEWLVDGFSPLPTIALIIWLDFQWIWPFPCPFINWSKHFFARAGWGPPARGDPRARKNASTNC